MERLVKCEVLDAIWKRRTPGGIVHLYLSKARRLEGQDKVRIIDPVADVIEKTVKKYKTKVITPDCANCYLSTKTFTGKKKYKIAWVQDYSKLGGAELSNMYLVDIGERLGYDIVGITPNNTNTTILESADLIVINNIFEFTPERMGAILRCIYEKRIPYVKYDHDHREMRRKQFARQLFTMSRLNIFISPMHLDKMVSVVGEQIRNHSLCLPLAIDTKLFKINKNYKRIKNSVLIPTYKKCGANVNKYIEKNADKSYTFLGNCTFENNYKVKAEIVEKVELGKMVELYNTHEYMLHVPMSFWAGERVYFEAMLCGCKCVTNENVGHVSWNFNKRNLRGVLDKAPYRFWDKISEVLKGV